MYAVVVLAGKELAGSEVHIDDWELLSTFAVWSFVRDGNASRRRTGRSLGWSFRYYPPFVFHIVFYFPVFHPEELFVFRPGFGGTVLHGTRRGHRTSFETF